MYPILSYQGSTVVDHLLQVITKEWHVRWSIIGNIDIATCILTVSFLYMSALLQTAP